MVDTDVVKQFNIVDAAGVAADGGFYFSVVRTTVP